MSIQAEAYRRAPEAPVPRIGPLLVEKGYLLVRDNNRIIVAIQNEKTTGRHPSEGSS